jgi:hypothetical protein
MILSEKNLNSKQRMNFNNRKKGNQDFNAF